MEPTIEFRLIAFADVQAASFSTARIPGDRLSDRILFARTRSGKYAKLQVVRAGMNLHVTRLTLYDPDGTVLPPPPQPFVVRSSFAGDLENGQEVQPGQGDLFWHGISLGVVELVPDGGTFAPFVDFEAITYADVRQGPWALDRVEGPALKHQIFFCRTPRRRWAKLLVETQGHTLVVKRLVVWGTKGRPVLDASNIQVPQTSTLQLDTGSAGLTSGYDLWWEFETNDRWFLTPANGTVISYPSYYRFAKYLPLLRDPTIQKALYFERMGGYLTLTYENWLEEVKLQLDEYLYLLDTGRPLPLTGPPPVTLNTATNTQMMDWKNGRKIYLAHVAQSLWVEANQLVPWRLSGNATELEYLFDSRRLFSRAASQYYFGEMGAVTAWNPQAAYAFLKSQGLIGADPFSTIKKFAHWCRSNLRHITDYNSDPNGPFASQWDQFQWYYGYRGLPPVELVLSPPPGKPHVSAGCWGTSGLFAGVLRSVNVPVRHGRTNFSGNVHSRPEFVSVGQNLAHGDDPYNRLVGVGHHTPPIGLIFYTDADLAADIDNPTPLPGKTVPETTSINQTKKFAGIAVQYKTDYLLGCRCWDVQNAPAPYSRLWNELQDVYSRAQLKQIIADCDTEIAALGGCSQIPPI